MPNRLFHYQQFDPQKPERLVSILKENKIRLSRPDSFNDPWDCRVHYKIPANDIDKKQVLEWIMSMHRKHYPSISEEERARRAEYLKLNPAALEVAFIQMEKDFYATICQRYRVYCLTEKPDCPLMWAHYANSHKGICLEFDGTQPPFTVKEGITKVRYLEAYPAYNLATSLGGYESLFTKSIHWSYEAEWRLIAEEKAFAIAPLTVKTENDFLTLPNGLLKSVTIGSLADEYLCQQIKEIIAANAPHLLVRQATISPDKYELIIAPPFV